MEVYVYSNTGALLEGHDYGMWKDLIAKVLHHRMVNRKLETTLKSNSG